MKILYGTTNPAKLNLMRCITKDLDIEIIGLSEMNKKTPKVDESGNNPLENAQIKANAYYEAYSMPVFSCDSGLYFDNIEETLQPGTHVRRVNGRELSDEEMIDYYANLAAQNKNQLIGRYLNAIYLMIDRETYYYSMDETLATKPFMLVSKAHKKRVAGFPLDSLSVDISSGKYYYDMAEKIVDTSGMEQEFFNFFQNVVTKSK